MHHWLCKCSPRNLTQNSKLRTQNFIYPLTIPFTIDPTPRMNTKLKAQNDNLRAAPAVETPATMGWMFFALLSHTAWGGYPVVARYLQKISGVPSMVILVVSGVLSLAIMLAILWRRQEFGMLSAPVIWSVATFAMVRSITNVLSVRYAPAVYVQLINLLTPFLIVVLGKLLFKESIPRHTIPAVLLSMLGSLAMFSGNFSGGSFSLALQGQEWLGLGLAAISTLTLALYMLMVRVTNRHAVSSQATFTAQLILLVLSSSMLSAIFREDWSFWRSMHVFDWFMFLFFSLAIMFGANYTQISALRALGAPRVSSMQAWRLVIALLFGGLLLGEWLLQPLQIAGAVLVIVVVSLYLWQQYADQRRGML